MHSGNNLAAFSNNLATNNNNFNYFAKNQLTKFSACSLKTIKANRSGETNLKVKV